MLVIVDSLPLRIQMKKALAQIGAHVDFAGSGERVFERIETQRYALVFLDGGLASEDAYDICSRIRNHPLHPHIPIVMLTGSSAPVDRLKGKLAGCDTWLLKPVLEEVLQQLVNQLLKTGDEERRAQVVAPGPV